MRCFRPSPPSRLGPARNATGGSSGCLVAARDFSSRGRDFISPTTGAKVIKKRRSATSPPAVPLNPPRLPPPRKHRPQLTNPHLTSKPWWKLTAGWAGLVTVGAVIPVPASLEAPAGLPLDKLAHLCEYLLFAWLLVQAATASRWSAPKRSLLAFALPVSYGLFLEGAQACLPYRSAELLDVLANTVGAGLGVWLARVLPHRRQESIGR